MIGRGAAITILTMKNQIQDQMDSFISYCINTRGLSAKTIKGYRDVFRHFCRIMPEIEALDQLTPKCMDDFFLRLRHRPKRIGSTIVEAGLQASTLRTYGAKLKSFFGWLCDRGHLQLNPITKKTLPKVVYDDKRALNRQQVEKIYGAVTQHVKAPLLFKRDMAMLQVLLFCGLRKNELLSLRLMDVDLINASITVIGRTSKSKFTRKLPINPMTVLHLEEYLTERRKNQIACEYLWVNVRGGQLTEHGLKHWVDKMRKRSGVRFYLHQFRHSFACMLGRNNVSAIKVQHLMGHSDLRMTQSYLRSLGFQDIGDSIGLLSFDNL